MTRLPFAAALLGLAAAAAAQVPATGAGISFDQWSVKARARLMALDTDHDGRISKDEFAARAAMMGKHDANASGAAPKHDGARMFARLDSNNDGYLDTAEINAMLAQRFARQDANHDNMLTADERHAMRGKTAPE